FSLFLSISVQGQTLQLEKGNLTCGNSYDCAINLLPQQNLKLKEPSAYPIYEIIHNNEVIQYYFYSTDLVKIPAYSGKPIEILIAMDPNGTLTETRLIKHDEPILIAGIPPQKLTQAIQSYQGKNIVNEFNLSTLQQVQREINIITGATVTSLIAYDTILQAAKLVAQEIGLIEGDGQSSRQLANTYQPMSWQQLLESGAIGHVTLYPQDIGLKKSAEPLLDLYFANLMPPSIGINLLGERDYEALRDRFKQARSAILLLGNGTWSFKGTAFSRGGIFDRFHLEQDLNTFNFRDTDYEPLYYLAPTDIPDFSESGIFMINDPAFDNASAWDLVIITSKLTGETALSKSYQSFYTNYTLPSFMIQKLTSPYQQIWIDKLPSILLYSLLWFIVILLFIFRRQNSSSEHLLEATHMVMWTIAILMIGVYFANQPSIINLLTMIEITKSNMTFATFLLDPLNTIAWLFILITLILWGRPLFCGWICPFGALQELLYKIRTYITPFKKSYEFSAKVRYYLKPLRYIILFGILSLSLFSLPIADRFAEIEPFKTVWNIGILHRPFIYGSYAVLLILMGLVTVRFFCRYLCPLGAAFSLISFIPYLPLINIPRRNTCAVCKLCARGCGVYAISKQGEINLAECLGCHECINKMYDVNRCPPLKNKKIWDKYEAKKTTD
ncbi:MAG: 4Fe-4S binding protein, partial [Gammaproteobacteria bacterium]